MPHLKPFLLVPSLLTERWDAEITIPLIKPETPVLLLAGQKDELVLPVQMRGIKALREKTGGKVKWVEFPNGTHSALTYCFAYRYTTKLCAFTIPDDTCMQPGYWNAIIEFLLEEGFIVKL